MPPGVNEPLANAPTTVLAAIDNWLKRFYEPYIVVTNANAGPVYDALRKVSGGYIGQQKFITLQYGRSAGIGARPEVSANPVAGRRPSTQGVIDSKNFVAHLEISDKMLRVSKTNQEAFVDQLKDEMQNLAIDTADMIARNFQTDHNGILGTATAAAVGDTSVALTATTNKWKFYAGQLVDVFAPGAVTGDTPVIEQIRLADVDYVGGTIWFRDALTTAIPANGLIVLHGSFGLEMTGLDEIFDNGNVLYGIDRSANHWYNTQSLDKSSEPSFQPSWLDEATSLTDIMVGQTMNFFVGDHDTYRTVAEVFSEMRIVSQPDTERPLNAWFRGISYEGIPFIRDKYCPPRNIRLLTLDNFELAMLQDWTWMDLDGGILSRTDSRTYTATMVMYGELVCKKPAAQAQLTGIPIL